MFTRTYKTLVPLVLGKVHVTAQTDEDGLFHIYMKCISHVHLVISPQTTYGRARPLQIKLDCD